MTDLARLEGSLRDHEGVREELYLCPAAYLTIAIGHNLEANPFTGEQLRTLFDAGEIQIALTQGGISRVLGWDVSTVRMLCESLIDQWVELNDPRQNALIELAFQLGISGLMKFKRFHAAMSARDWVLAKKELIDSRWARQTQAIRVKRITHMIETGEWPAV